MADNGLNGFLRNINDVTRTIKNVSTTKNSMKKTKIKKDKKSKNATAAAPATPTAAATPAATVTPAAQTTVVKWTCSCGTENTTKFCGGCGKAAPVEAVCPNCGLKRPPENAAMKFCGACGTKFPE